MRLISQDGMIDVPYDKCCLEVEVSRREGSVVYFIYAHTNKMTLSLARYSTEAKVLKAMEMVKEEYLKYLYGAGGEIATRDLYIQPFAFLPPKVFKFPKDEEIEV